MAFFKNNYEKIILAVLLVVFAGLLVFILFILKETTTLEITQIIAFEEPAPDYKKLPIGEPEYDVQAIFSVGKEWMPITKRGEESGNYYTDLLTPYPLAECLFCRKLIPTAEFPIPPKTKGQCPLCKKRLPQIREITVDDEPPPDLDTNKNGILDETELKYGLDLNDSQAINRDLDGDGFTFKEEIVAGTDPTDPKSHPPYATKLSLETIRTSKIHMRILKIVYKVEDDPSTWEVQMDVRGLRNNRPTNRTEWPKIGSVVRPLNNDRTSTDYKIVEIKKDIREEFDRNLKAKIQKDYSTVTFERIGSEDRIVASIDKDINEPRESVTFLDMVSGKKFEVYVGMKFSLGSVLSGIETYIVDSIRDRASVKIIGADGQIQNNEFIIKKITASDSLREYDMDMPLPPQGPPPPPASGTGFKPLPVR